jgi:peptidyl-prolyl cis-trans isomerase C
MMSSILRARSVAALLLCGAATVAFAQNAAIVNGHAIPKQKVDDLVQMLVSQGRPDTPELRAAVRDELIARELFVQEADKKGIPRQAAVQRQIDDARQQILIGALIADYLKANPISDADVAAEYQKMKAQAGGKEYKARHILVEKEDDAKKIIEQLKKGAKFEELAKQSKDTGSAQNGGELDWSTPASFVKPFSDAMVKLEKGKFTETPVQSQFGWHVIRLDDVRDVQPPPLEQVKPQILQQMQRQKVQQLQQSLRAKAKIQ